MITDIFKNYYLINFKPIWVFSSFDATTHCSLLEIDTNLVRCGKHAATKEIVSLATRNLLTTLGAEPTLAPICRVLPCCFLAVPRSCKNQMLEAQILLLNAGSVIFDVFESRSWQTTACTIKTFEFNIAWLCVIRVVCKSELKSSYSTCKHRLTDVSRH